MSSWLNYFLHKSSLLFPSANSIDFNLFEWILANFCCKSIISSKVHSSSLFIRAEAHLFEYLSIHPHFVWIWLLLMLSVHKDLLIKLFLELDLLDFLDFVLSHKPKVSLVQLRKKIQRNVGGVGYIECFLDFKT